MPYKNATTIAVSSKNTAINTSGWHLETLATV